MGEKFGLECGICTQIQAFNSQLRIQIEKTLELLTEEPFNSSLRTHKLKGDLDGVWSCSINYDNRILFEFIVNPDSGDEEIFLLTLGSHDEVY